MVDPKVKSMEHLQEIKEATKDIAKYLKEISETLKQIAEKSED